MHYCNPSHLAQISQNLNPYCELFAFKIHIETENYCKTKKESKPNYIMRQFVCCIVLNLILCRFNMKKPTHIINALYNCTRVFLFVALVLRFLIPQGFMIDDKINNDGHIRIVLCKAQGSEFTTLDLSGKTLQSDNNKQSKKNNQNQNMENCNFVGFNAALDLQIADFEFDTPFFTRSTDITDKINVYIGNGLAAPPPPSTGPPTNA